MATLESIEQKVCDLKGDLKRVETKVDDLAKKQNYHNGKIPLHEEQIKNLQDSEGKNTPFRYMVIGGLIFVSSVIASLGSITIFIKFIQ